MGKNIIKYKTYGTQKSLEFHANIFGSECCLIDWVRSSNFI